METRAPEHMVSGVMASSVSGSRKKQYCVGARMIAVYNVCNADLVYMKQYCVGARMIAVL